MKPNFALSLSFEGISLLHRVAGGWRTVGEVSLDADDMAAELAVLRKTASSLEPGGVRTKLLIPNEQIKYLTIQTPGLSDHARLTEARRALDGATPYAVDDLAFDISSDGPATHVAAVAQETLAEAEAFATEHRFHPVSFVAVPDAKTFIGEPFFGPTEASGKLIGSDDALEPDDDAVVVLGDITQTARPEPEPEEAATQAAVTDAAVAPTGDIKESHDSDPTDHPDKPDEARVQPKPSAPEGSAAKAEDQVSTDRPSVDAEESKTKVPTGSGPALTASPAGKAAAPDVKLPSGTKTKAPVPVPAVDAAQPAHASPAPVAPPTAFASRRSSPAPALGAASREGPSPSAARNPTPPATPVPDSRSLTAPAAVSAKPKSRLAFLSRRKPKVTPAAPAPRAAGAAASFAATAGGVAIPRANSEAEQMTVFGARKGDEVGGKPRFLGLLLTAILLLFLAGVAAWAAVFLDDTVSLSRLFGTRDTTAVASAPQAPAVDPVTLPEETAPEVSEEPATRTALLDPTLSDEDGAVLDALRVPELQQPREWTLQDIEAKYATTGIWAMAPDTPTAPSMVSLDDLYMTGIDPVSTASDAVALPQLASLVGDTFDFAPASPAPAGTSFSLNDQGLVRPSADGTMNPDGVLVFAGRPAAVPPQTLSRAEAPTVAEPAAAQSPLLDFRPKVRPSGLVENNERSEFQGLTRVELAAYRPSLRPKSVQEAAAEVPAPAVEAAAAAAGASLAALPPAETAEPAINNATAFAVKASIRPDLRPQNFARIVKRAEQAAPAPTQVASSAAVAPRTVAPSLPSKASVAKQATVKNAIKLRDINLIGVYGKPSSRRALIRLSNGRYQKVAVGDQLDGGRVSAIGDNELRYNKRGRDVVLKMPRG